MQDRYAADLGDFSKLGLLRALCMGEPGLSLGMQWYLAPEEQHNNDGRHVGYLNGQPSNLRRFRACDAHLYDALAGMLASGERSVQALEALPIWPGRVRFFSERLQDPPGPLTQRRATREGWAARAFEALAGVDLVCVDPDNGLPPKSARAMSPKYARPEELAPFVQRGQSLVIYQHAHRACSAAQQLQQGKQRVAEQIAQGRPVQALLYRRGSTRFYFIVPAVGHEAVVERALTVLTQGPWAEHTARG